MLYILKISLVTYIFTLNSLWISPMPVTGYIAKIKKVAILKKKWINYKNLCLRYSKIFIYHIILR
jgi:hypothetical protein